MKRKPEPDQDPSPPPPEDAPAAAAASEQELAAARELAKQLKHQTLELTAEIDNQAKRFARERQVVREEIVMRFAREMIEVLDNLDLVVNSLSEAEHSTPLAQGVDLTRSVFLEKLKSFGVEPIESIGRPFDPAWHESLFETETDAQPPGTILSELSRGWRLGNKVVRAAKVELAKPAAAKSAAPDSDRRDQGDDGAEA